MLKVVLALLGSYLFGFKFVPSLIRDHPKVSTELKYWTKWIFTGSAFVVIMIVMLLIDVDSRTTLKENLPFQIVFEKTEPRVAVDFIERDVSLYSPGDTIENVAWEQEYEKYELVVVNQSEYSLHDFNCYLAIPGFVLYRGVIDTRTDNPKAVDLISYEYETEMLKGKNNGRYKHSENVVTNRLGFFIEKLNADSKVSVWFFAKPATFDGKLILEYYIDSRRKNGHQSANLITRASINHKMNLNPAAAEDFLIPLRWMPLDAVTLNNKDSSVTIAHPTN
jgi:hypothetical protein